MQYCQCSSTRKKGEVTITSYFKSLYFSPTWSLVVIGVLAGSVCCGFGFWQLDRADEKTRLAEDIKRQSSLPAMSLIGESKLEKFRKVESSGRYLLNETFYLDNMIHDRRPGYHVISLLDIEDGIELVLVNRGWVAGLPDRSALPDVDTPDGTVFLEGTLVSPRVRPFFMGNAEPQTEKLRLYIDIEKISQHVNRSVLPYVVQMTSDSGDGLVRVWSVFDAKVSMHQGYALQWFAFTLFGYLIAVYSCFKKKGPELGDI